MAARGIRLTQCAFGSAGFEAESRAFDLSYMWD